MKMNQWALQCNILRWHDEEEFVVFMGLLCQHFRVLVPLMSAPLEQGITPNTGAINVYSLLEFTASLVPISGLWPTESKAVNEWQFIESPSTGRSMPNAGTDEDSKVIHRKREPRSHYINFSGKEYKNITDHMNELSEGIFYFNSFIDSPRWPSIQEHGMTTTAKSTTGNRKRFSTLIADISTKNGQRRVFFSSGLFMP